MFSSLHQSGVNGIEIFSPSGNDPLKNLKLTNEAQICKIYDRDIKGYLLTLEKESSSTCIQAPHNSSECFGITQPLVIFQIYLFLEKNMSLDLKITDSSGNKRRLQISTCCKELECNGLHCRVPWILPLKDKWMNFVINLQYLVAAVFPGVAYASLDSFTLHPCCRIRKIFTLPLVLLTDWADGLVAVPTALDFPAGVECTSFVFKLTAANKILAGGSSGGVAAKRVATSKGVTVTVHEQVTKPVSKTTQPVLRSNQQLLPQVNLHFQSVLATLSRLEAEFNDRYEEKV